MGVVRRIKRCGRGRGGRGLPATASLTSAFWSAMSCAHALWMFSENHAMFDAHVSALSSVLHVPQMITFRRDAFRWLCFDQTQRAC